MPFPVKRTYWIVYDSHFASETAHANKKQSQVIVALRGQLEVRLQDRSGKKTSFMLCNSNTGLLVPPLHWKEFTYSNGLVLLCFASGLYCESEYIRDYANFRSVSVSFQGKLV
ncbi:MAG: FdtA/QdtA family cupin domain-containing protein [Bacteroidetes bacterium]|nr:FdtA/QdtA family cupin domain-containing protein [Bacteroidota bacterium]